MKKQTPKMTITAILVVMSIILSCSSSRTALNCPEILQSKNNPRASSKLKKPDQKAFAYSQKKETKNRNVRSLSASRKRYNSTLPLTVPESVTEKNKSVVSILEEIVPIYTEDNTPNHAATKDYPDILEQSLPISDPIHFVAEPINKLPEANEEGMKETTLFTTNNSIAISDIKSTIPSVNTTISQDSEPQIEGLGLAGFVSGVVGLLVGAIPLGLVATIFGAVSLSKIRRNPTKFKGRGFAIASLTLGIIDLVFGLIIIAVILAI